MVLNKSAKALVAAGFIMLGGNTAVAADSMNFVSWGW